MELWELFPSRPTHVFDSHCLTAYADEVGASTATWLGGRQYILHGKNGDVPYVADALPRQCGIALNDTNASQFWREWRHASGSADYAFREKG